MSRRVRKNEIKCVIEHSGQGMTCSQRRLQRMKACGVILVLLVIAGCADPVRPTQTTTAAATTESAASGPPGAVQPPTQPTVPEPPPAAPPAIGPTPVVPTWYAAIYCGVVPLEDSSLTAYADRVIASDGDGPSVVGGYKMCGNIPVAVRVRSNIATVQVYETEIRLTFIGYRDGHVVDGRVLTWAEPDTYTETIETGSPW